MHWIAVTCSFWYAFSLAGGEARYGFDLDTKKVTLFDNGRTKINHTTFPQLGHAVGSLLSLTVNPEDASDNTPHLS